MIADIDAFDRDTVIGRIAQLERKLFGRGAWSEKAVREELSAPARTYIIDIPDEAVPMTMADVSDAELHNAIDTAVAAADAGQSTPTPTEQVIASTSQPAPAVLARAGVRAPALPTIRGYAGYWYDGDDAELMTIGVGEAYQRQGIARAMLCWLIDDARKRGAQRMLLEVRVDNEPALSLYRRLGFTRLGLRRRYYQPENIDAYTMSLELRPPIVGFQTMQSAHVNADSIGNIMPGSRGNLDSCKATEQAMAATAISVRTMNRKTNRLAIDQTQKEEER
jgi:ribosomal-protein-alanine N-acetyltransferase